MRQLRYGLTALGIAAAGAALAADHADAPLLKGDKGDHAADITDVYLFRAAGKLVGAINITGAPDPQARVDRATGSFDPKVLFTYQLDTNCDGKPDRSVYVRFGTNAAGQSGVQLENVPGAGADQVAGPVEKINTTPSGLRYFAGLRDDPFFFDFVGFTATEATFGPEDEPPTGMLMFDHTRDSFGQRNITSIVFEMDLAEATKDVSNHTICAFATSGRMM